MAVRGVGLHLTGPAPSPILKWNGSVRPPEPGSWIAAKEDRCPQGEFLY